MKNNFAHLFVNLALLSLLASVVFGCFAAFQYVYPDLLEGIFSFQMSRPEYQIIYSTNFFIFR